MPEMVLAGHLLRRYPLLYSYIEGRRANIIHGYRQGSFGVIRAGSGVSDPTGNKVVRIDDLTAIATTGKIIRQWIDTGLKPEDRPLLLAVWRGKNPYVDGRQYMWEKMTLSLAGYMNQYASAACGRGGIASAGILHELFPA